MARRRNIMSKIQHTLSDINSVVFAFIIMFAVTAAWGTAFAADSDLGDVLSELQQNGRVVVMRHTQTVPGVGDPNGFKLNDCATQRNLNQLGIDQAKRFGAALNRAGVRIGRVLVSEWCRADDTARLILKAAGVGDFPRIKFWQLNNVWDDRSRIKEQVAAVRAAISEWRGPGVLLMVSHGVTIRPVVGRSTSQGGFFVLQPSGTSFEIIAEGRL